MLVPSCGGQESGGSSAVTDSVSSESVRLDYRIAGGMDGPEGKGYPNPEIVEAVEDVLLK